MALALYDVTAAPLINTLEAVSSILDKGLAHCREAGIDPVLVLLFHIRERRSTVFQLWGLSTKWGHREA